MAMNRNTSSFSMKNYLCNGKIYYRM